MSWRTEKDFVSHVGSALLAQVADKTGLTRALSRELGALQKRAGSHDRGRVVCDLAVTLADGGDLPGGPSAPSATRRRCWARWRRTATAFRVIDQIASSRGMLDALRAAHATARDRVWQLSGAPDRVTIDLDARLLVAHSDKEGAAPT